MKCFAVNICVRSAAGGSWDSCAINKKPILYVTANGKLEDFLRSRQINEYINQFVPSKELQQTVTFYASWYDTESKKHQNICISLPDLYTNPTADQEIFEKT